MRIPIFVVAAAIFTAAAHAQQTSPSTATTTFSNPLSADIQDTVPLDPQAVQALLACQTAMGAPGGDLIASGTVTQFDGTSAQVVMKTKGLMQRTEETGTKGTVVGVAGPGSKGYAVSETGAREAITFAQAAHNRPEHLPALACQINPLDTALHAVFHGVEQVGGTQALHVEVYRTPKTKTAGIDRLLSEYHVYIDAKYGQVLKFGSYIFSANALGNRSTWEAVYADYRQVAGTLVPFRIERFIDGQKYSTVVLDSIQSSSLSAEEF